MPRVPALITAAFAAAVLGLVPVGAEDPVVAFEPMQAEPVQSRCKSGQRVRRCRRRRGPRPVRGLRRRRQPALSQRSRRLHRHRGQRRRRRRPRHAGGGVWGLRRRWQSGPAARLHAGPPDRCCGSIATTAAASPTRRRLPASSLPPGRCASRRGWMRTGTATSICSSPSATGPTRCSATTAGASPTWRRRSAWPTRAGRSVPCGSTCDEDGDLDVAVANMDGDANGLFRNDGGRFTDVAEAAGVAWGGRAPNETANGTVRVCAADVDGDGRLDLFAANYGPHGLFLNQRRRQVRGSSRGLGRRHRRALRRVRVRRLRQRRPARSLRQRHGHRRHQLSGLPVPQHRHEVRGRDAGEHRALQADHGVQWADVDRRRRRRPGADRRAARRHAPPAAQPAPRRRGGAVAARARHSTRAAARRWPAPRCACSRPGRRRLIGHAAGRRRLGLRRAERHAGACRAGAAGRAGSTSSWSCPRATREVTWQRGVEYRGLDGQGSRAARRALSALVYSMAARPEAALRRRPRRRPWRRAGFPSRGAAP